MTGSSAAGSGVQTLSVNQSSPAAAGDAPSKLGCGGGAPYAIAGRTPSHLCTGRGAWKRRAPTGGWANEIPRKTACPASQLPRTTPATVRTSGPTPNDPTISGSSLESASGSYESAGVLACLAAGMQGGGRAEGVFELVVCE